MGIDLAKTSNDESVWGSWIEQPSNFDDVKKIHNAFQSLKCDYYGNSNIELCFESVGTINFKGIE